MDIMTQRLSKYIKEKGFNLSLMSRETGIPYVSLYDSLINEKRDRDLRTTEYFKICKFIGVNPLNFSDIPREKTLDKLRGFK